MVFCTLFFSIIYTLSWVNAQHSIGPPLSPHEFSRAETFELNASQKPEDDPIHLANLYEGDIAMSSDTSRILPHNKNGIKDEIKKWKNGIIPYTIDKEFDGNARTTIACAMLQLHKKTCIRFQPRNGESDFVAIVKGSGCSSYVGRQGGRQELSLGVGCVRVGICQHEMMHAIGFWHEQSRADRDDFINIYWDNIKPGATYNFQKFSWDTTQNLSQEYDLQSIMHYGPYAFTKQPGMPTILPKNSSATIGQRNNYSGIDLSKINKLYNCQVAKEICKDLDTNCKYWASIGECSKNAAWMSPNCKESCGLCCSDNNEQCPYWAGKNECKLNPNYMEVNCKKSCGKC